MLLRACDISNNYGNQYFSVLWKNSFLSFFLTFTTHCQYPVPLTPYFQESLFVQL